MIDQWLTCICISPVSYVEAQEGDDGQRLDNFLLRTLGAVPRSLVYRILRTGEVRVNGRRAKPAYRLAAGDRVRLPPLQGAGRKQDTETPKAPSKSLREFVAAAVIHEDRDLIVVNKPAGVAVHGGSGVSFGVIEALRAVHPQLKELELVHRLDRETSGCLLVAKRRAVLRDLHAQLREREMEKRYLTLVAGRWPFGAKTIDLPLKTNLKQGGERVVRVHSEGQQRGDDFQADRAVRQGRNAAGCRSRHRAARTRSACMLRTPAIRWPATRSTAIARRTRS